jgi:peptide-methionine (S)-S-oxide reductase
MKHLTYTFAACAVVAAALISGLPIARAQAPSDKASVVLAGGCFWCLEKPFDHLAGVSKTVSGYSGGHVANPDYESVSSGRTGHIEVVQITYDAKRVSFEKLLDVFFRNVDPFDGAGQFCDRGGQYRPAIFVSDAEERRAAEMAKQALEKRFGKPLAVAILPAAPFYAAEEYHQNYYQRNPLRYRYYRSGCGRDKRLDAVWGAEARGESLGGGKS